MLLSTSDVHGLNEKISVDFCSFNKTFEKMLVFLCGNVSGPYTLSRATSSHSVHRKIHGVIPSRSRIQSNVLFLVNFCLSALPSLRPRPSVLAETAPPILFHGKICKKSNSFWEYCLANNVPHQAFLGRAA